MTTLNKALSNKQISSYAESTARINIWEGSVRSGKSFISILKFIEFLRSGPRGQAMVVGPSRDSIQRNFINQFCELLGSPYPTPKSTQMQVFGKIVHLVGANDERAQRKIQGSTISCAYVDEITQIPQGFFEMLLSRLSVTGAKLFGTTNPDSPYHWLKTKYLDRDDLDLKCFKFTLEDNPSLDKSYIDNIKKEYTGLWYDRYIEGKWVLAEGVVYNFFEESLHTIEAPPYAKEYLVGVDYGITNPTAFVLVGYNKEVHPAIWVEKEYYFDSREKNYSQTDADIVEDLMKFVNRLPVRIFYLDPSAASLKYELKKQGITNVRDADNDVLNGIRFVSNQISNGTLKICKNCQMVIKEISSYRWDPKASNRGEDKPIKDNDHALDALRYVIYTHFQNKTGTGLTADEIDRNWQKHYLGYDENMPAFFR